MTAQWIAVAIIVPLCALSAVWQLLGAPARQRVRAWLAAWPWPTALRRRLERGDAAADAGGCHACGPGSGCAAGEHAPTAIVRVVRRDR